MNLDINPIKTWLPEIDNPLLIAGPCSLESEEQALSTARELAKDKRVFVYRGGVWKPRTRPGCFEGIGSIGLEWLKKVREETGLLVGTEVATAYHVKEALKAEIDVLWIGARSTGSPFVIQEIADALKGHEDQVVMVKNPVSPDVALWEGAMERLNRSGIKNLVAIHRGFTPFETSKYRNHSGWQYVIKLRNKHPNLPIICDPSHIAGSREYLLEIAQKAFDLSLDGCMIESHISPDVALSDAKQQVTPQALSEMLDNMVIRTTNPEDEELESVLNHLRSQIDSFDQQILELLTQRMKVVVDIANKKKERNMAVLQLDRWQQMQHSRKELGKELKLDDHLVTLLFELIHGASVRLQTEIIDR